LGFQASYGIPDISAPQTFPLFNYGRIWVYDAGISLSLAAAENWSTAHARFLYLKEHAVFLPDPREPSKEIFAGWAFSANQEFLGDDYADPRYINGANAWTLLGIAEYIVAFKDSMTSEAQAEIESFFVAALDGLLFHIEDEEPNLGLVTAGWSVEGFEDATGANEYNAILGILGYDFNSDELMERGFSSNALNNVKARNVVTEHNIDFLKLLNFAIKHFEEIFPSGEGPSISHLITVRNTLKSAIFSKLYNSDERRFITGRTASGKPSVHTAIDNTTWLTLLALRLEALTSVEKEELADSLYYTAEEFTREFNLNGETYFGAHYFLDDFWDPYISRDGVKSDSYHIEATAGLIIGLHDFADAFPRHQYSAYSRTIAFQLWKDMQRFVDSYGLIYSSTSIDNLFEPLPSTVSAVWFLWAYDCHYRIRGRRVEPQFLNVDGDVDGLLDSWEHYHFGNLIQGASSDPDTDGWPNLIEYSLGMNPIDGDAPLLSLDVKISEGVLTSEISYQAIDASNVFESVNYVIEESGNLEDWSPVSWPEHKESLGGGLQSITLRDSAPAHSQLSRFVRLRVIP
jgi:hypothetical protein